MPEGGVWVSVKQVRRLLALLCCVNCRVPYFVRRFGLVDGTDLGLAG